MLTRANTLATLLGLALLAAAPAAAGHLRDAGRLSRLPRAVVPITPEGVLIDFENLPPGETVYSQYADLGITFPEEPEICEPLEGARSGAKALTKYHPGDEFDPGPLTIEFSAPQQSVWLFAGLDDATGGRKITAALRAYDGSGSLLATAAKQLGPGPTPVSTLFGVTAPADSIVKVELHYQTSYFEVIDDLIFTAAGSPGAPDTASPIVDITTPVSNTFLDYPAAPGTFPLEGTVYEERRLKTLRIRVESDGQASEGLVNRSGVGPTYTFGSPSVHGLIFPGKNYITVTAEDYAGNTGSDTVAVTYEPLAGQAELLILTPRRFRGPLCGLRDWKRSSGITCHIMTIEGLESDPRFRAARDIQERIKRMLAYAWRHHGTRYAMLVGDGDAFPVRYTRTGHRGVSWGICRPASDLYYADLFKTDGLFDSWDANGDGVYGDWWAPPEEGQTAASFDQINIDACDLRPDIAVGRLPASTVEEVSTYVQKVMHYESRFEPPSFSRILLFSGPKEFPGEEAALDCIARTAMPGFDFIKSYRPDGFLDWSPSRKADYVHDDWEPAIADAFEDGIGFAFCFDHGERDVCGPYSADTLADLHNPGRRPVVLASGCNTAKFIHWNDCYMDVQGNLPRTPGGQIDRDNGWTDPRPEPAAIQPSTVDSESMAEHFLVDSMSGAVGFIGAHSGTNVAGLDLCRLFPEAWDRGHRRLGDMWNDALTRFINTYLYAGHTYAKDPFQSHHIHKYLLFGDPSLRLGGVPADQVRQGEGAADPHPSPDARTQYRDIISRVRYPSATGTGSIRITGEAPPGTMVGLYEGRRRLGETQADASGRFAIQLAGLKDGTHAITLRPAGRKARSPDARTILVDVQAASPTATHLKYPRTCAPGRFVLTGKTQYDETWVELFEGKILVAADYAQHGGTFVLRPTSPLSAGPHTFSLRLVTPAGRSTVLERAVSTTITGAIIRPASPSRGPINRPMLRTTSP